MSVIEKQLPTCEARARWTMFRTSMRIDLASAIDPVMCSVEDVVVNLFMSLRLRIQGVQSHDLPE